MVKQTMTLITGITALVIVAAGCGDDDEDNVLTKEEAVALFNAVTPMLSDTLTPIVVSDDSIVVACPQGGTATVRVRDFSGGWVDDTWETRIELLVNPIVCKVSSQGLDFTTGGDPNLRFVEEIDFVGRGQLVDIRASGTVSGGVTWELAGGRSGRCDVDVTLVPDKDLSDPAKPKLTGVYKGKVCDHEIEADAGDLLL